MTILAIILDIVAFGGYLFQVGNGGTMVYVLGLVLQVIVTLFLIRFCFRFGGQRHRNPWIFGWFTATFRYGVILISTAINALVLVMYVMNILGINNVIFANL